MGAALQWGVRVGGALSQPTAPQHQGAPKAPGDQPEPVALSAPPARLLTHVAADDAASVTRLACMLPIRASMCRGVSIRASSSKVGAYCGVRLIPTLVRGTWLVAMSSYVSLKDP